MDVEEEKKGGLLLRGLIGGLDSPNQMAALCLAGLIDAKVVSPLLPLPTVVRPVVRREDLLPAFVTKVCSTATAHVKTSFHSFDTNLAARTYLAIVLNPYEDGLVVHFGIGV